MAIKTRHPDSFLTTVAIILGIALLFGLFLTLGSMGIDIRLTH